MPTSQPASLTPATVMKMLRRHAWLWIAPAIAGLVLTAVTTLVTPRKWKATQGMIVRSEAAGYADQRLGKFTDLSEMRTVQETVLELARSRSVLTASLEEVGPPPSLLGHFGKWPTADDIEAIREDLRITPPGGAEFGKTEVFYVTVLDTRPKRAVAVVDALAKHLDKAMQDLRNGQAQSMVEELETAAQTARNELERHTVKLATIEQEVGADLADLRSLESALGGQGALAQQALAIETELRQNGMNQRRSQELLATLRSAQDNPGRLLATPSALLTSQPAIQRLKDGLVDAQIRTASMQGTRSESHPLVVAAFEAEALQREQLHKEIPSAIAGVELELSLSQQRGEALREQLASVRGRLGSLAGRRAEYSTLVAAVQNQTRLVDTAEAQLAEARAHSAGVGSASLLARVDGVEAGIRPVGPGRASVTLAGGLGGLILGLALVFIFGKPETAEESRAQMPPAEFGASQAGHAPRANDGCANDGRPGDWRTSFPTVTASQTPFGWSEQSAFASGETNYAN